MAGWEENTGFQDLEGGSGQDDTNYEISMDDTFIDYDDDNWNDDIWWEDPVDDSGLWWASDGGPSYEDRMAEAAEDTYGDYGHYTDDLFADEDPNTYNLDYGVATEKSGESSSGLKGLLGNKNVWGAIGGLAKEGFGMWQKQQSQERADQLRADANAEWERRARLTASLRKSGGGGGKAPTIAAKTTGADREGDFTKRT